MANMPVLVVGDVHGDLERLFQALKPYPAAEWHTIFLGDLVDYGMFGVGALRYARDRANSTVILGNHEVAIRHESAGGWGSVVNATTSMSWPKTRLSRNGCGNGLQCCGLTMEPWSSTAAAMRMARSPKSRIRTRWKE